MKKWARKGFHLWVYQLSPADATRLKQLISEPRTPEGKTELTISADVAACHRTPLGSAALPMTTLLRTNYTGYFVLTRDLDLRNIVTPADLAKKVPPCAQTAATGHGD